MTRPRFRLRVARSSTGLPSGAIHSAGHLETVYRSAGVELAVGGSDPLPVLDGLGRTVVGRAFDKSGQPAALPSGLTADSFSEHAVRNMWGMFVAVEIAGVGSRIRVTRDASSLYPVYYIEGKEEIVVASDVESLGVPRSPASIDWISVATHLRNDTLRRRQTCLTGITELLPGEALVISDGAASVEPLWSPWTFTAPAMQFGSYEEAVDALREALVGTVATLSRGFRHGVIGVSGGLDSSIVAALLDKANLKLSALTLATHAPGGDERHYAGIATRALGIDLTESLESLAAVDIGKSEASHLPRPLARAFAQWGNRRHVELADQVGADVFFNGGGGDNVFCALHSVSMLADHLLTAGLSPGVLRTARDLAVMGDVTWFSILKRGIKRARRKPRHYRWPLESLFLTEYCRKLTVFEHPWLTSRPADTLPGKSAHVAWLMGIQNHLEGFSHELVHPIISPLVAQPVQELCLRIPTWFWCAGGRNRAVARDAMASFLPEPILARSSKGTPSTFVLRLMRENAEQIREMLNYGLLAERGFVDTGAVNACLDCPDDPAPATYARMMALVDVEAWLQSWRG